MTSIPKLSHQCCAHKQDVDGPSRKTTRPAASGSCPVAYRIDIALHRNDEPPEPGAFSIRSPALSRAAEASGAWLGAAKLLMEAATTLPQLWRDVRRAVFELVACILATTKLSKS